MKKLNVKNNFTKSNQKGITLIALIVTIIVLIIIAGISIATLTADNGVLRQTNLAKIAQIEGTAREQVKLATSAMRLAVAEARAQDNSYSAIAHSSDIQAKLLDMIKNDNTGLKKEGWGTEAEVNDNVETFTITYAGADYRQACNNDQATITYTIKLGQSAIEITNEVNATLKDQNQNDVEIDIGGNDNTGGGNGTGSGGNNDGTGDGGGNNSSEDSTTTPGLYDANDVLLASWDELTTTYGMDVTKDYVNSSGKTNFYKTNKASPYYVLTNNDELASGVKLIMGNVTSVGEYAFASCNGLTSITIPASVTAIGNNVFYGWVFLENVTFEENSQLTSIGQQAFYNCQKLTTIKIPAGVTTIGNSAFNCCYGLKNVEIPASVTTMGYNAFGVCTSLESITFGENSQLTSISASTFNNCYALTSVGPVGSGASVEIPASVTTIGNGAFYRCYGLKNVEIPDGVVSIDETAFEYCTALTSLDLGNGVTTISKSAFKDCTSLTRVEIPDSVRTIGVWAFRNCTNITSLTVDVNNKKYYSAGDCIIETASKTLVVACGNSIIPNGVITIGRYAFADFQNITTIEIPDSVTSIDVNAFDNCTNLTSIIIPDRVTEISNYAFSGCTKLEGIIIPASVTTIGYEAFCNCTGLTNITFKGTMSQWNAITKGSNWNKNVPATTVQCSDGTVTLN